VQLLSLILKDVEVHPMRSLAGDAERAPWTELGLFEVLLPVAVKQAAPPRHACRRADKCAVGRSGLTD
jgi:hypothetical protein